MKAVLLTGFLVSLLLSIFWSHTLSSGVSAGLLVLAFFGSMVCCVSNVVYYPFISTFPRYATPSLAIGESLSGATASLFALSQVSTITRQCSLQSAVNVGVLLLYK